MSDYESLDEVVKAQLTEKEYLALPDELKKTLMADITMPEVEED